MPVPKACDKAFMGRFFRFVNNNDIVPQVPAEPVFAHVKELRQIGPDGRIREAAPSVVAGLPGRADGIAGAAFNPAGEGIRDHFMKNYVAALERNLA